METLNRLVQSEQNGLKKVSTDELNSLALYVEYCIPTSFFPNNVKEVFYYLASLCSIPEFSDDPSLARNFEKDYEEKCIRIEKKIQQELNRNIT